MKVGFNLRLCDVKKCYGLCEMGEIKAKDGENV